MAKQQQVNPIQEAELEWKAPGFESTGYMYYAADKPYTDRWLVNVMAYKSSDKLVLRQRPRYRYGSLDSSSTITYRSFGGHYWYVTNKEYVVTWDGANYKLQYKTAGIAGAFTSLQTLGAISERKVFFLEYNNPINNTQSLILFTGAEAWIVSSSNTISQITDSDFPTHEPMAAALDGYVFVVKAGTGDIYNCAVGDPTTWQATTFIRCEQSGAQALGVTTIDNYLVAYTRRGIEFFKNAGISSPNSPLARVTELFKPTWVLGWPAITQLNNTGYFAGWEQGDPYLALFSITKEGVKRLTPGIISSYLDSLTNSVVADTTYNLIPIVFGGKTLLVSNSLETAAAALSNVQGYSAYVHDIENGIGYFWNCADPPTTLGLGNAPYVYSDGGNGYGFPVIDAYISSETFNVAGVSTRVFGKFIFDASLYAFDSLSSENAIDTNYVSTRSAPVSSFITFDATDMGTNHRKFYRYMDIDFVRRGTRAQTPVAYMNLLYYVEPDLGNSTWTTMKSGIDIGSIERLRALGSSRNTRFAIELFSYDYTDVPAEVGEPVMFRSAKIGYELASK